MFQKNVKYLCTISIPILFTFTIIDTATFNWNWYIHVKTHPIHCQTVLDTNSKLDKNLIIWDYILFTIISDVTKYLCEPPQ